MNVSNSYKKIGKLAFFFSLLILILAVIKSFLSGEIGNLTLFGFFQALAISVGAGTIAAIALFIKDEKDKKL